MRRMLIAGALALAAGTQAFAADLPPPAPPPRAPASYVPIVAPPYSWGGFYLGINGGYGFGDSNWTAPAGALPGVAACVAGCSTGTFNTNGFLIGGTMGANFQMGAFVFGVEGDLDWNDTNGTFTNGTVGCAPPGCETKTDWLATTRGRVGYAFDRILIFATGGAAFGNVDAGVPGGTFSNTTAFGWTAGAGVEAAFAPNWTAKAEYLYVDLGNTSCGCGATLPINVTFTENLIRVGINYKFNY